MLERQNMNFDYEKHIKKSSENWIGYNFPEPFRSHLPWFRDPLTFWDASICWGGVEYTSIRQDRGTWNGYAFLPSGHKYEDVHYDQIPYAVHGGLTYADWWEDHYVIGFDTNHMSDFAPNGFVNQKLLEEGILNYKSLEFVLVQARDLAKQIKGREES